MYLRIQLIKRWRRYLAVSSEDLRKLRSIADYQYGYGAGLALLPDEAELEYSRNTGRVRHIYLDEELQGTFRPNDGMIVLTIPAARRLVDQLPDLGYTVTVNADAAEFVQQGKNVFAKHVLAAGPKIRPGDEVIVLDESRRVIGIGKSLLTAEEIPSFKTGVAVKTRRGVE
jgi:predicted RNA-binding protein (TIGR00451 family)